MRKSRIGKRVRAALLFTFLAALTQTAIFAQKSGPAAKGGSLARGRIVEDRARSAEPAPEKYRDVTLELGLNYDELVEEYSSGRTAAHPTSFKTVVLAHLIARELTSNSFQENASRVLAATEKGGHFEQALRDVFSLTGQAARRHARAAEKQFEQAIDKVRRK